MKIPKDTKEVIDEKKQRITEWLKRTLFLALVAIAMSIAASNFGEFLIRNGGLDPKMATNIAGILWLAIVVLLEIKVIKYHKYLLKLIDEYIKFPQTFEHDENN